MEELKINSGNTKRYYTYIVGGTYSYTSAFMNRRNYYYIGVSKEIRFEFPIITDNHIIENIQQHTALLSDLIELEESFKPKKKKAKPKAIAIESNPVVLPSNLVSQIKKHGGVKNTVRYKILKRDGFKCLMCGSEDDLTLDHVISKAMGGKNGEENYQTLCVKCNRFKGAFYMDFRKQVRE